MGLDRMHESQSSKTTHDRSGRPYSKGADPTRKQRKRMPIRFQDLGQWPVHSILDARGPREKCEYQVDWEVNPLSKEIYPPSWIKKDDVGPSLIADWEERMFDKAGNIVQSMPSPTSAVVDRNSEESINPEDIKTGITTQAKLSTNAETITLSREDNLKSSFGKNSTFLPNDSGQSMSQVLLLMAHVAADWSEFDGEDEPEHEHEVEAEIMFKEKLHQALQKQIEQSKLKVHPCTPKCTPRRKRSEVL